MTLSRAGKDSGYLDHIHSLSTQPAARLERLYIQFRKHIVARIDSYEDTQKIRLIVLVVLLVMLLSYQLRLFPSYSSQNGGSKVKKKAKKRP